ncbi:hypothetical protein QQF64_001135 [Cirrhinus molitorella]|uniref:Uncharacterized protein n=1 Tax=Cirrhinus molitorella TaxID=172907 RepID=A0ABR3NZ57_9TELE
MTALGLQPFLTYLAVINLRHKGEQMMFDSSQKAEDCVALLSLKTYCKPDSLAGLIVGVRMPPAICLDPLGSYCCLKPHMSAVPHPQGNVEHD